MRLFFVFFMLFFFIDEGAVNLGRGDGCGGAGALFRFFIIFGVRKSDGG